MKRASQIPAAIRHSAINRLRARIEVLEARLMREARETARDAARSKFDLERKRRIK
jgi:hypothetical protein